MHPPYPDNGRNVPRETFLQFGIELETESRGNLTKGMGIITDRHDKSEIYCKEDGSLSSEGVEIVSHPRRIESWQTWTKFGETIRLLTKAGWVAWDDDACGLHIHASRAGFDNTSHQMRLAYIARKADWVEGLTKFAGRQSGYARWDRMAEQSTRGLVNGWDANHTDAINFSNPKTVELRIFKPALRMARVVACVELYHALIEFTRITPAVAMQRSTWNNFTEWVHAQGAIYSACQHVLDGGNFANNHNGK
jgi:hypothetical protein